MHGNRIMTPKPVIGLEGRTNSSMLRKRLAHAPRIRITYGNNDPLQAGGKAKDQHPELIVVPAGIWRCATLSSGKEKIQ